MGDLISRKALMEDFRNTITENSDTFDWLNMIARQPTAFDLESVICTISERLQERMEYCGEEESAEVKVYRDCLEILTSAANVTNGKIGG